MRKLRAISVGAAVLALAGAAVAAPKTHHMDVRLPDGSVAHVEYVGDVAPKITVDSRPIANAAGAWGMPFPSLTGFDRMMADMHRQSQAMIERAQTMTHRPTGAAPYVAGYGNLPAGETSTTVVTISNNGSTCTRTTEVVSQGAGKLPKVTSNASGQCSGEAQPSPRATHPA